MRYGLIVVILSMIFTWTQAYGQKPVDSDGVWITIGVGQIDSPKCMNINASYCYAKDRICYRYALEHSSTFSFGRPRFSLLELNGSMGKRVYGKYFLVAQYVGISIIKTTERGYQQATKVQLSPGLCANSQAYIKPLEFLIPEVGIGLELFGDLNFANSFAGVRMSILFHNTI